MGIYIELWQGNESLLSKFYTIKAIELVYGYVYYTHSSDVLEILDEIAEGVIIPTIAIALIKDVDEVLKGP
jgi:hypothetical protein